MYKDAFLYLPSCIQISFDINNIILPSIYSRRIQNAADSDNLKVTEIRNAFVRESVAYFERILPRPTHEQYSAISKAFCDKYPSLNRLSANDVIQRHNARMR